MTKKRVTPGDGIAYGFNIFGYLIAVSLGGGLVAFVGFSVVDGSNDALMTALGGGIGLLGVLIIVAGLMGLQYKIIADGVRTGLILKEEHPTNDTETNDTESEEASTEQSEEPLSEQEQVLDEVVAWLQDEKIVRNRELKSQLYPEYPLGFESADEWFEALRPELLADSRIKQADNTGQRWTLNE